MKIGGVPVSAPPIKTLVLPRDKGKDLVFRAKSVANLDEFRVLFPPPVAPVVLTKDGPKPDLENKDFIDVRNNYYRSNTAFMVIRSLEPSNIEWDTVDLENPKTFTNWEADMKNGGVTDTEIKLILDLIAKANSLNEDDIREATDRFVHGQDQESDA